MKRLKEILAFFIFLLSFQVPAFGQEKSGNPVLQKISLGVELAPTFSWFGINNDQIESDGGKLKLNAGLNTFVNLTDRYALATGIHINSYGGSLKGDYDRVSYKFNEIEVPFGLRLRTGSFNDWRFTANMGLGLGIEFNGKATKDTGTDTYKNESYGYTLFPFRALYNLGFGFEHDLHGAILTGRINYNGGFNSLYFYDHGIGNASRNLDLQQSYDTDTYKKDIYFRPSAIEFAIGVIF